MKGKEATNLKQQQQHSRWLKQVQRQRQQQQQQSSLITIFMILFMSTLIVFEQEGIVVDAFSFISTILHKQNLCQQQQQQQQQIIQRRQQLQQQQPPLLSCSSSSSTRMFLDNSISNTQLFMTALDEKNEEEEEKEKSSKDYIEIGFENDTDDEDDQIAPNDMKVSEIKAELDLRGVTYKDCFDKDSLSVRLEEARATGKADPKILDEFNKKKLEENIKGETPLQNINDEDINAALGADGTLPGGMTPDKLKELMSNPELMILLQSTKMQEVMKLIMTEGPEELTKQMEHDPEIKDLVIKLNQIIGTPGLQ